MQSTRVTAGLRRGQYITSSSTNRSYKVLESIGFGGYGRAYIAQRLNRMNNPIDEVCLKITNDQPSWHREAYFGELFFRNRRVIQILDTFVIVNQNTSGRHRMLYCLAVELARFGTVADYVKTTAKAWKPRRALREVSALLKVVDQLHMSRATHRDITPSNVFVCSRGTLKLGDFGIARHDLGNHTTIAETFNASFVSRRIKHGDSPRWKASDDIFQMGQLLAMLLVGHADQLIQAHKIKKLTCDDRLKEVILKAIGSRNRRYANAREMLQALEKSAHQ